MAYLTIHKLSGDPQDLKEKKQTHFDPLINEIAPRFGALFSFTAESESGLTIVNLWKNPEDAQRFSQLEEIRTAQINSGLPMPSLFERYEEVQVADYQQITQNLLK